CANMASIIESLFGRAKTPAERLREHQRSLQKAVRELDRERSKLEQQDKKLIMDIKKAARDGQMGACKVMARDLVRTRRHVQKFVQMRTQLQAVSLRIQTLRSNQQMAEAMRGATRAMGMMNRSMNLPAIQRIMRDFERETQTMDMKEEMMGDAVDEAMDEDADGIGEEEEGDAILGQVLDEIGVSLGQQLTDAPTGIAAPSALANPSQRVAIGEGVGAAAPSSSSNPGAGGPVGGNPPSERAGSQYGDLIRDYIKEGKIVPSEVTVALLANAMSDALSKSEHKGGVLHAISAALHHHKSEPKGRFLVDGFPRQMDQALVFDKEICENKFVLFLTCTEEIMLERLLDRGKTSGRADDNTESIKKRFHTFVETSMPVVEHYRKLGKVVEVDSTKSKDEVYAEIKAAVEKSLAA
ncbi:unnamed protein product, partial [Tilletia controversa]